MAERRFLAGVAEMDITPPLGVEMCGYGPYEKRVCTAVLDPLFARALWLQSGDDALLIVTLDLCTVDLAWRNAAAGEIAARLGIPAERIMIAASHTHSGPAAQRMIGWGERDEAYLAWLRTRIVAAAGQAQASAVPARAGACRQRVEGAGYNREQPALGPVDTAAQLLRVDTEAGVPLTCLFNVGVHGVGRYPFTARISADWPGLACAGIRTALPPAVGMFLQGCLGNIDMHPVSFERDDVALREKAADMWTGHVAARLCEQMLPALQGLETRVPASLAAAWATVELPCLRPSARELEETVARHLPLAESRTLADLRPLPERIKDETEEERAWRQARYAVDAARHQLDLLAAGEDAVRAPVQLLRIGDAVLVGWPGEVFVELGLELRQRSPFPLTFVAGFANDTVGYIPTPAAFESQGRPNQFGRYPVGLTPRVYGHLPFRADVGRVLVEETLRLLHGLREEALS